MSISHVRRSIVALAAGFALAAAPAAAEAAGPAPARTNSFLSNASHTAIWPSARPWKRWRASNKAGDTRRRQEWAERWP